jgi:hypothetical protein
MLQAYSLNVDVANGADIPFNTLSLKKGYTAELSSPTTIALNKCGVYMVEVDIAAVADTAGLIQAQLYKNGIEIPQAQATVTGAADTTVTASFTCLVQVDRNNNPCCACSSPTLLKLTNDGVDANYVKANIVVTKVV